MGVISRGVRNAFRNSIRTISVTFILGLSIAMALIMLLAYKTVQAKITSVKSSIGNTITVSPSGIRGFEGGGELLTEQNATDISAISHVSKVTKLISDHLAKDNTSLSAAIEAGSFGGRGQRQDAANSSSAPENFAMPVMVTGTNSLDSASNLNASKLDIISGEKIDPNSSDNIAMVGTELATKNNLTVGSVFQAYGQDIKAVGIFDGGNRFANGGMIMPIKAVQKLSNQVDQINSLIIQTDSIDSLSSVSTAIKQKLGDKADITTSEDASQNAVAPLENIKTISLYSLIGSLVAGSVIIFLVMIMIVRERRKEIGVLKAIGASNMGILSQFTVESLVLTLMSSVLGIILGLIFSNPVLKVLVNNSTSTAETAVRSGGGRGMGGAMMRIGEGFGGAQNLLNNIHAVVGWDVILYGILAAIVIAVIGSAIPSFIISKIRPAEVMRAE